MHPLAEGGGELMQLVLHGRKETKGKEALGTQERKGKKEKQ